MKKLVILLALVSFNAHAIVKCQSMRDPGFKAYFEGYSCPAGFYQIL